MSDPEVLKEVGRWLRYAREDLETAALILEYGQVPRAACFRAQQAAEKAIKGALIFVQIYFPKTHSLVLLIELLPEGWRLKENPSALSDLSGWAVEPRYPGDLKEATKEDARVAVEQARKVYETALEDLEEHGYKTDAEPRDDKPAQEEKS